MPRVLPTVLALMLAASMLRTAEAASHAWLGATIRYDPAVWHIRAPGDGPDLLLTCIAADCPGRPTLYGYAWRTDEAHQSCASIGRIGYDTKPVHVPATPLGFAVSAAWTGCRARDEPVVEACAATGGIAWRIVSRIIRSGCNRQPAVPDQRLIELLEGIVPAPPRP